VQSTELQPAIAISNPARAGAAARLLGPNSNFDIEDSSISIYEFELQYRRFFDMWYFSIEGPFISMFLHFWVLQYRSIPTSILKYRPLISKLHIVPDIKAKPLNFDIDSEGLVFDIVHISI
jgi:hypothetical protein